MYDSQRITFSCYTSHCSSNYKYYQQRKSAMPLDRTEQIPIIREDEIHSLIRKTENPSPSRIREIFAKALELKGLDLEESHIFSISAMKTFWRNYSIQRFRSSRNYGTGSFFSHRCMFPIIAQTIVSTAVSVKITVR